MKNKGKELEAGKGRSSYHNASLTPLKGDRDRARRALDCTQHSSKKVSARLLRSFHTRVAHWRSPASQANEPSLTASPCSVSAWEKPALSANPVGTGFLG